MVEKLNNHKLLSQSKGTFQVRISRLRGKLSNSGVTHIKAREESLRIVERISLMMLTIGSADFQTFKNTFDGSGKKNYKS